MNNNRKIHMNTNHMLFVSILFLVPITESASMTKHTPVGVQLVGIYNKLTQNSNTPSTSPATVRIKTTRETVTGLPWVPQEFLKVPVEVEVLFQTKNLDDKGNPQPYVIHLEEGASHGGVCPADKTCVTASIYARQLGDLDAYPETKQTTCISKSVFFIKKGDLISQWQNVMLFLADPDDPTSPVPFKCGLCAWTATHGLWKYDFIDYAPADSKSNAPKITFDKKPTAINNTQELKGLRVLQGQQAWGGGQLPRAYFVHIAHIYNNSPYQILVRRTVRELSAYNFVKIIPPRSIMPFAMIWIPKIADSTIGTPSLDPIQLFVLRKSQSAALPEAFSNIDDVGGTEISSGVTEQEINGAVDSIVQNMTAHAQDLASYNAMIDDLKKDPSTQYIIGKNSYKIFAIKGNTINDPQTICINRCPKDTLEEETIYHNLDSAYHGVLPKYYLRLVINEAQPQNNGDLITFDIANISYETVFES